MSTDKKCHCGGNHYSDEHEELASGDLFGALVRTLVETQSTLPLGANDLAAIRLNDGRGGLNGRPYHCAHKGVCVYPCHCGCDSCVEDRSKVSFVGYSCIHCGGGHLGRDCNASVRQMNAYQRKMGDL